MEANNESFEKALVPQPNKRKRSSILKQPDKRASRDSRTVSFNDRYYYKELHQDGTCEITNLFLSEDMDITMMDIVDPNVDPQNQTIDNSVDMSMDRTIIGTQSVNISVVPDRTTICQERTLDEGDMLEDTAASTTQDTAFSDLDGSTLFGAFHDSNNISDRSSTDTLMHNIQALDDCIQKLDHETEACRLRLDSEIEELFKFYRNIVNKNNKYEFAVSIFGLRHSLWLIIKINPETYPHEKLRLRFAFNRKDRDLYPFKEYAQTVETCTKEGTHGYLTRFVINAQRFRRFLRKVGYRKIIN